MIVSTKKQLVIDLFDGSQNLHKAKNPTIIISFSSQLLSKFFIHKIVSSAESGNIFTWMQELCEEKPENEFPFLREVYKEEENMTMKRVGEETYFLMCTMEKCFTSLVIIHHSLAK